VPPGGNMIKIGWFGRYETPIDVGPREQLVISWDTAMKASEMHDYSVGTVWLVRNNVDFYLLEVIRERLEYPLLKRKVAETSARYARVSSYCNLVIEDAGSGIPLIQDLIGESLRAFPFKPEGDKALRMSAQSAKIEAGHVFLPNKAPWLDEFETEVMAFPHGAHDDQVDSMAQALDWVSRRIRNQVRQGYF